MKRILGLDLGTNSIGWAVVNEAENDNEESSVVRVGVRVNPLTADEQNNFEKGKSISTNSDRTLKRSMRRNLHRYKLRRKNLISVLKENRLITDETLLSEDGKNTTFETYRLRAKAATEQVSLEELSRILLMINKKRGYKSSRKVKEQEDGTLLDGMEISQKMYNENLTPGALCYQILCDSQGKKSLPDFYRSDLEAEFERIWNVQQPFWEFLTDDLKRKIKGKSEKETWAICAPSKDKNVDNEFVWHWKNEAGELCILSGKKRSGKTSEQQLENFLWRKQALTEKLSPEKLIVVFQKINKQINDSSGYLGSISDRSKELYFKKLTVGQYQMQILENNPHQPLRNMIFYRQDYLDEFNKIWETQRTFYPQLTEELKSEIRDIIIFYQRRLKSKKGLISFCEFENRTIEVEIDGKKVTKTTGNRVIPRSSPLFQEFKIWQTLNNLEVSVLGEKKKKSTRKRKMAEMPSLFSESQDPDDSLIINGKRSLSAAEKTLLAGELMLRKEMKKKDVLNLLFSEFPKELDLNYEKIDGNTTGYALFQAFGNIVEQSGHDPVDWKKPAAEIINYLTTIFQAMGWNSDILRYNSAVTDLDSQPFYLLWHLLYSFEGDQSKTGDEQLVENISARWGFDKTSAKILANISFLDDYGSLSAKAIKKILPYMKEGKRYDEAVVLAGYGSHSKESQTKEEIENKELKTHLEILPKNSLRNPVVEKILNQMVHVINQLVDAYGIADEKGEKHFDEIRVELAREMKKNAKEREELTKSIGETTRNHKEIEEKLKQPPFSLKYVSRNDIIRYKLWQELEPLGHKTLYSNTYISATDLFNSNFDIEHIIPQARLFDDSFSNKTLELRSVNLDKGNRTAYDFIQETYGETELQDYIDRVEKLYNPSKKADEDDTEKRSAATISRTKYRKLLMKESEIPEDFIERDLRNTQYIAKKALSMLKDISRDVVATTGSITDALREDWGLMELMRKLNWNKYHERGLTEIIERSKIDEQGHTQLNPIYHIKDWTKRNDHRHHALDALTVAFTKRAYIQYFNNKNASLNPNSNLFALKRKYVEDRKVLPPMPNFLNVARIALEDVLVSIKAKNKVVTPNINTTQKHKGNLKKVELTPRGQLHKETIYGSQQRYVTKMEKINGSFDEAKIATVAKKREREALLARLQQFGNDPKKAFTNKNRPNKNPIYLNEERTIAMADTVKVVNTETIYTIRKAIDKDLKLEKVIDKQIRAILQKRLDAFDGNADKAFSNLDENPIWFNKAKGIAIKSVVIEGVKNAVALHQRRDKEGNPIKNEQGKSQPVDFVSTGNNHHVAIYCDAEGNWQERVVSFFEATQAVLQHRPVIDKAYRKEDGWTFLFTMKQNEYFVFPNKKTGFDPQNIDLLDPKNSAMISPNLFRVQKLTTKEYTFRHHLETQVKDESLKTKEMTWKRISTPNNLRGAIKVRVNHIGQIVFVGEY